MRSKNCKDCQNCMPTWSLLNDTKRFGTVYRLAITADGKFLFAATSIGLFRSSNFTKENGDEVKFETVWSSRTLNRIVTTIVCHPSDSSRCIAAGNGKAYATTEANTDALPGLNDWRESEWRDKAQQAKAPTTLGDSVRIELAYAAARPDVVYASVDVDGGHVYRSENGGKSFVLRNDDSRYFEHPGRVGEGQGSFDSAIWAGDPDDPNLVVIGGIDVWRSFDGGTTLSRISHWADAPRFPHEDEGHPRSAHADQHTIVADPRYGTGRRRVYFGNDGGVYSVPDIRATTVQWEEMNNGYAATLFYSVAAARKRATGKMQIIGGTQDNSTLFFDGSNWQTVYSGDGGFVAVNSVGADEPKFYGSLPPPHSESYGIYETPPYRLLKFIPKEDAGFVSPFVLDPRDPKVMFAGTCNVWRSGNVTEVNPRWVRIGPPDLCSWTTVTALEPQALSNSHRSSDVVWVGYRYGPIWKLENTGREWRASNVSRHASKGFGGAHRLPSRDVTRLRVIHGRLFALFAGYDCPRVGGSECPNDSVWYYDESLGVWTAVRMNIAPMPVYDITVHPRLPNRYYLATEHGMFMAEGAPEQWAPANFGPANVGTRELHWLDETLFAATYGRGIWSIDLSHVQ